MAVTRLLVQKNARLRSQGHVEKNTAWPRQHGQSCSDSCPCETWWLTNNLGCPWCTVSLQVS